jgi:hypothetical protein
LSKKTANFFAEFFGENILKIITSVPGFQARPESEAAAEQPSVALLHRDRPRRQDPGPVIHSAGPGD